MTGSEYQLQAARTINRDLKDWEIRNHALFGMSAEVGELHSIYQKIFQGHIPTEEHLMKEVGDLLWFIAEYCTIMGWCLSDIMQLNIDKLKARYPDGFDPERSTHRKEGDI